MSFASATAFAYIKLRQLVCLGEPLCVTVLIPIVNDVANQIGVLLFLSWGFLAEWIATAALVGDGVDAALLELSLRCNERELGVRSHGMTIC
jgi:hypothetical protein